MPEKRLFIVQQFERMGERLVSGRQMEFKLAAEAQGRTERDSARTAGVIALQQTMDTDTVRSSRSRSCWPATVSCLLKSMKANGGFRPIHDTGLVLYFAP